MHWPFRFPILMCLCLLLVHCVFCWNDSSDGGGTRETNCHSYECDSDSSSNCSKHSFLQKMNSLYCPFSHFLLCLEVIGDFVTQLL